MIGRKRHFNGVVRRLLTIILLFLSTSTDLLAQGILDKPTNPITEVTTIIIGNPPVHEIRFSSGKTAYAEGLFDEQWIGRSLSTDGQGGLFDGESTEPSFRIEI